jgi:hypothetical protein
MENISPTLTLLLEVRAALDSGYSVRTGIVTFLQKPKTSLHHTIAKWFAAIDHQQNLTPIYKDLHPCRRALFLLLEKGLKGTSIQNHLLELEKEIVLSCESEMEEQIKMLPFKMLIPVLFLMFPAYLILLFGPFLQMFLQNAL